jgi:hypothetical protein
MLSASTNKLSKLKEQAQEFAELIMEELDSEGTGYIEVSLMRKHRPILFHIRYTVWLQTFIIAMKVTRCGISLGNG